MTYYARLEIQDENDQAMVVSSRNEYLGSKWHGGKNNKSSLQYSLRNLGTIKDRIKFGQEVRYYLDCIDQTGLVGFWSFDGDAKDDSPPKGSHDGTLNGGASWSKLDDDIALKVDGASGYVLGSQNLGLSGDAELTMICDIYWSGAAWVSGNYPSAMGNNSTGTTGRGLSLTFNQGRPAIDFWSNRFRAGDPLNVQTRYRIAVTKTPGTISSTTCKIYVNGLPVTGALEGANTAPNILDSPPVIGRLDATRWFNGLERELKWYNRALSPAEILDDANGKAISNGLICYYRCDEGQGTIAYDSVTTKYDGTITGCTFVDGTYGKAIKFARNTTDKVAIPKAILDGATDCTVMFFVKHDPITSIDGIGAILGSVGASNTNEFVIYVVGSHDLGSGEHANTTNIWLRNTRIEFAQRLDDGIQHFIAVRRRASAGAIDLFVDNNAPITATGLSVNAFSFIGNNIYFGQELDLPDGGFDANQAMLGTLEKPFMFRRALSDGEIATRRDSLIFNKRVFTGVQLDYDDQGTFNEVLTITCRDLFDDLRQSESLTKKYVDQEVADTVTDIINGVNTRRNAGLATTEIADLGVSHPYNFVVENLDHAVSRIAGDSFSELFMRPNKSVVLRELGITDSKLEINDANIRNPAQVASTQGISDSYGIIRVVGGLSTESYDSTKRIIAEHRVPAADATIAKRVYTVADERFTTWSGAKMHAMTLAADIGSQYFAFEQALSLHDINRLPAPGELVLINSTEMAINRKFVCDEIEIADEIGSDSITHIDMKFGQTEYSETRTLRLLRDQFEQDKRKDLDQDADTNQRSFCVSVKLANGITLTITTRNPASSPYVWGDGDGAITGNEGKWGYGTWGGR